MQNINRMVTSVPDLVRILRLIAWTELGVITLLAIIGFCSTVSTGFYFSLGITAFSSLVVTLLQAGVFWGVLMGVALLLENQARSR
jgi:hypothetical protein